MVITPAALARSKFTKFRLGDMKSVDFDEVFYFRYPSADPIDEHNGDGHLLEIWDFNTEFTEITVAGGRTIRVTPDTEVYGR